MDSETEDALEDIALNALHLETRGWADDAAKKLVIYETALRKIKQMAENQKATKAWLYVYENAGKALGTKE